MKKPLLLLAVILFFAGCKKKDETINNYVPTQPSFVVSGISDVSFVSAVDYLSILSLTVQYLDSAQENVTLSVTGLPAGIVMDTTWIHSGVPTFSTSLQIFDTNVISPGNYPVKITASTTSGKTKSYPFNVRIVPMPTAFLGKYDTCNTSCGGTAAFKDSLYIDPSVPNKVWFSNFANSGNKVYALITVPETLTIPGQTVNGITYSGTAYIQLNVHRIALSIHTGTTGSCSLSMR